MQEWPLMSCGDPAKGLPEVPHTCRTKSRYNVRLSYWGLESRLTVAASLCCSLGEPKEATTSREDRFQKQSNNCCRNLSEKTSSRPDITQQTCFQKSYAQIHEAQTSLGITVGNSLLYFPKPKFRTVNIITWTLSPFPLNPSSVPLPEVPLLLHKPSTP